jgi:hypothetical protein
VVEEASLVGFGSAGDEGMSENMVGRGLVVSFPLLFWGEMVHSFHPFFGLPRIFAHPAGVIFYYLSLYDRTVRVSVMLENTFPLQCGRVVGAETCG